jgi:hypothetical protein
MPQNIEGVFAAVKAECVARRAYTPLLEPSVARAERALGRTLPPLLKQLYLTCGNGGFGPNVRPLVGANDEDDVKRNPFTDPELRGVTSSIVLEALRARGAQFWPEGLLCFCDHGCNVESCIDTTRPELPIVRFEPRFEDDSEEPTSDSFEPERASVMEWLQEWLAARAPAR